MLAHTTVVIIFVCLFGRISGTLNVTLLLFSGEPDPEWQIKSSNPRYQKIQRLLESARKNGLSYGAEQIPAELGYRGILVKTASTVNTKPELIIGRKTVKLQKLFLQTIPEAPEEERSKGIPDHVLAVMKKPEESLPTPTIPLTIGPGPVFDQTKWTHTDFNIMINNNCYNYANDVITIKMARPGRGGGTDLKRPFTGADVKNAAILDGLIEVTAVQPENSPFTVPEYHLNQPLGTKRYFVALFVKYDEKDPNKPFANDYHWYRLDSNGLWSHKLGKNAPTNLDFNGKEIKDPRNAARRGIDYKFICFMTTGPNVTIR